MLLNARFEGDIVVLSNFAGLMNDPRHFDASRDVRDCLDQGYRKFVLELAGIREMGTSALGLLMTLTRQIRQHGGELVLSRVSREMRRFLDDMKMEEYWEVFDRVEEAEEYYRHESK